MLAHQDFFDARRSVDREAGWVAMRHESMNANSAGAGLIYWK